MLKKNLFKVALAILSTGAVMAGAMPAHADRLSQILKVENQTTKFAQASQKRINVLADDTQKLLDQYREVTDQVDTLKIYNNQLDNLIASQNREMKSLKHQIDNVTVVNRQITPLMLDMIKSLKAFVAMDVPFLKSERRNRLEKLDRIMEDSNIGQSEKFRTLLEAYQIENEYGRTIEAYEGELAQDGKTRTVNYLRVGRVAYLYQTLDGKETGVWDQKNRRWTVLPESYKIPIRQGLRIARKQATPNLLILPIPAPETAQ